MSQPQPGIVVVPPTSGRVLRAFGDEVTFFLGGEETAGNLTVSIHKTPPGGGPPPHYHEQEDEWFYPLSGTLEFLVDGSWSAVPVGSVVFVPRGQIHSFRNVGEAPSQTLIHTTPAGFEVFFQRCSDEFAKPGPPDMSRIVEIASEHGIHFVDS